MKEIKAEIVGGEKVIKESIKNERGSIYEESERKVLVDRILHPATATSRYEPGPEYGEIAVEELGLRKLFNTIIIHRESTYRGNVTRGEFTDSLFIFSGIKWELSGLHMVECGRIEIDEIVSESLQEAGGMCDMRVVPRNDSQGATTQGQYISFEPLRSTFPSQISAADTRLRSFDEKFAVIGRLRQYCRENHSSLQLDYMPAIGFYLRGMFKGFYVPEINFLWTMDFTHYREGVVALRKLFEKIERMLGKPIQRISKPDKEEDKKDLTEDEIRKRIGDTDFSTVDITLGCDQEFELLSDTGSVVLPDASLFRNWNRSTIGLDGSQNVIEFRPAPGKTHRRLLTNIQKIMEKAKHMKLSTDGNHLPVGCHIHFGVGHAYHPHVDMLYLLDRFLTIPCYPINGTARGPESEACRYGRLSDYRPQPHGFEYRSLPASVMSDKRFFKVVLQISRNIVQKWIALKDFEFEYKASEYEFLPFDAYDKCCHISKADYEYFMEYIRSYKCELKNVVAMWVDDVGEEQVAVEDVVSVPPPTGATLELGSIGNAFTYSSAIRAFDINHVNSAFVGFDSISAPARPQAPIPEPNQDGWTVPAAGSDRSARRGSAEIQDIPEVHVEQYSPRAVLRAPVQPTVPARPTPTRYESLARSGRGSLVQTTASLKNAYRNIELFMTYAGGDAQQWAAEVRRHIRSTVFSQLAEIVGKEQNVRVYLNIDVSPRITEGRNSFLSIVVPTANAEELNGLKTYKTLEAAKLKIVPCDPTSLIVVQTDKLPLRLIVGVPDTFLLHVIDSKHIVSISEFIRDIVCFYVSKTLGTKKG